MECDLERDRLADLCDPELLASFDFPFDRLAVRDRKRTQPVAVRLHAEGYAGVRWWSAFGGEWHVIALFRDALVPGALVFAPPESLDLEHPSLGAAAEWLAVPFDAGRRR